MYNFGNFYEDWRYEAKANVYSTEKDFINDINDIETESAIARVILAESEDINTMCGLAQVFINRLFTLKELNIDTKDYSGIMDNNGNPLTIGRYGTSLKNGATLNWDGNPRTLFKRVVFDTQGFSTHGSRALDPGFIDGTAQGKSNWRVAYDIASVLTNLLPIPSQVTNQVQTHGFHKDYYGSGGYLENNPTGSSNYKTYSAFLPRRSGCNRILSQ